MYQYFTQINLAIDEHVEDINPIIVGGIWKYLLKTVIIKMLPRVEIFLITFSE